MISRALYERLSSAGHGKSSGGDELRRGCFEQWPKRSRSQRATTVAVEAAGGAVAAPPRWRAIRRSKGIRRQALVSIPSGEILDAISGELLERLDRRALESNHPVVDVW